MAQPRKLHDRFFKQAKDEGYAARSAYKLKQIQDRRQIIRRGDRVLDLGCAPGSWVQVASELVGPKGRVGGIDLNPVRIDALSNARTMTGDIFKTDAATLLGLVGEGSRDRGIKGSSPEGEATAASAPGSPDPSTPSGPPVDVLLSDMAPSTEGGGGGTADHFRSVQLCRRVLELVPILLRPGGNLVMKVFEGEAYPELLRESERLFDDVKGYKPEASRDVSREMFITAKGYKGSRAASPPPLPPGIAKAPPAPRAGWGAPKGPESRT